MVNIFVKIGILKYIFKPDNFIQIPKFSKLYSKILSTSRMINISPQPPCFLPVNHPSIFSYTYYWWYKAIVKEGRDWFGIWVTLGIHIGYKMEHSNWSQILQGQGGGPGSVTKRWLFRKSARKSTFFVKK